MGFLDSIGSAIGDVAQFAGDVLTGGSISNNEAIKETNQQNIDYAKGQTDFQERMSNSAYQRATEDMRKAGLNPMLAYSQGGASTPTGASPTIQAPRPGDFAAGLANTAKTIYSLSSQVQNMDSQTELNKAQANTQAEQGTNLKADTIQKGAQTAKTIAETAKTKSDARASLSNAEMREMERDIQKNRQDVDKALAPSDAVMGRILEIFGVGSSAYRNFRGNKQPYSEMEHLKTRGPRGATHLP